MPVIAKADTMTTEETTEFRKLVSEELKTEEIKIYDWIIPDSGEQDEKIR